jgi:hypothetical protein
MVVGWRRRGSTGVGWGRLQSTGADENDKFFDIDRVRLRSTPVDYSRVGRDPLHPPTCRPAGQQLSRCIGKFQCHDMHPAPRVGYTS